MAEDLTGAYGLGLDPVIASGLGVEDVNLITQQVAGAQAQREAAAVAAAAAAAAAAQQAAEEAELAAFLSNQEQARWAEEQIAAQNDTTFLEDLAQEYVDFIEGDSTTAEFLTDPIGVTTEGTIGVVTDVIGTDVITGSITAAGGAAAQILDPIAQPLGESAGKLLLPAVILGGAYLLLK